MPRRTSRRTSRRKSPRTSRRKSPRTSRRKSPRTSRRKSRRPSRRPSRRTPRRTPRRPSRTYRGDTPPAIPRERERHGTVENSITFTIGDNNTLIIESEDTFQDASAKQDILDLVNDQLLTTIDGYDDEEVPLKIPMKELFDAVNAILKPDKEEYSLLEADESGIVLAEAEQEWKKFRAQVIDDKLKVTYSDSGNMGSLEQRMADVA